MKRRRYQVKVTAPGVIFIALTIILGIAAVNTGNNLLYLIAATMLSVMALSGLSSFINLLGLEFNLQPVSEIYALQKTLFVVQIKNKKRWWPSFLLGIRVNEQTKWLPYLPGSATSQTHVWIVFPHRGWQQLPPIVVFSYFPLHFFSRGFNLTLKQQYLVYPRPIFSTFSIKTFNEQGTSEGKRRGQEGEFRSLRDFIPGDSLRFVHWLATAKWSKFMVKEFANTGLKRIVLSLSGDKNEVETELGKLTYLTNTLLKAGFEVGLKISSLYLPPRRGETQRRKILNILATYET